MNTGWNYKTRVLGQFHPGQLPPEQLPPWKIVPRKFPPRTITYQPILTQDNYPRTISVLDNCLPPGNYFLGNFSGRLSPRTIALLPDNYIPTIAAQSNDNYKLQFFHGYFLFLFHGLII